MGWWEDVMLSLAGPQASEQSNAGYSGGIAAALNPLIGQVQALSGGGGAASPAASGSGSSGGSSGGGSAAPATYNLNLNTSVTPVTNTMQQPLVYGNEASDKEKADYWLNMDTWWQKETEARLSTYNQSKLDLARLEMQYPEASKSQEQSQQILDARTKLAELENSYKEAKNKADTISVSTSVSEQKDGDKIGTSNTYVITDDSGSTVTTTFSGDNGGLTAAELRNKQDADRQKALTSSDAAIRAAAEQSVTESQAMAERDYTKQAALSQLENYREQFDTNLSKLNSDYSSDKLQGNQDLLMASNETYSNAVKNSREANSLLGQYNLGGSSLGGRLDQIAAEAANQANQVSALTYNQKMKEADRGYGDSRLALENQRADQENLYNASAAQAQADMLKRTAETAGTNMTNMASYANPDYWYGTMFDQSGARLNSFADMNSQAMKDYSDQMAAKYKGLQDTYAQQQADATAQQAATKADKYVSAYTTPAARTYETGLKAYNPVNSNKQVVGMAEDKTRLKQEEEGEL
jgi:hypothetical protein